MLNWGLETWKWKYLVKKLEPMTFRTAGKSVLSGVAVSQLLPYRTGEYLGRLAYVSDKHKIAAGILSVAGSFSQLLVTLLFGIIGFVIIEPLPYPWYLILSFILLLALLLIGYFYMPQFKRLKTNRFFNAVREAFEPLDQKDFAVVLVLSVLRYASFVIPYALIAQYFDLPPGAGLMYGMASVACIYFLQTVSPNFILTDLVIRVTVPAMVFGSGSVAGLDNAYIPGMFIYVFNVAVPMCIGAVILLLAKLRK